MDNNQDYTVPNEVNPAIELPKNPNTWLFVMVIIGISTIFGILIAFMNRRHDEVKSDADKWEKRYNEERKRADSIQNSKDHEYVKAKYAIYKIDSITRSKKPNEKITKSKLNEEIKSALTDE